MASPVFASSPAARAGQGSRPYLHHFGNDALGAVCNAAMARALANIDPERSCDYDNEAAFIAEANGRLEPDAPMPALFHTLAPQLEAYCSQGACEVLALCDGNSITGFSQEG